MCCINVAEFGKKKKKIRKIEQIVRDQKCSKIIPEFQLILGPSQATTTVHTIFWEGNKPKLAKKRSNCTWHLQEQREIHSNTEHPKSGIVFDFPISFEFAENSNQQTNEMDILPSGNIFRELQDIYDTGYFSSQVSIEDQWQQASETLIFD